MFAAGQCIGHRYFLETRIATGGMGEVWCARDARLERDVALKLLRPEHADDESFRTRLRLEAHAAGGLHCHTVVGVHDWGEQIDESGRWLCYIVMELVEGETVASLIAREAPLDATRTAGILADTASGLTAAHHRGLIHRDIKPANLLLTLDGRVKVADFGIARAKDGLALTATGMLVGTATYISPEQVRGDPATAASDVYSLGVVAYQCLTGAAPFRGDGDIATATARLGAPAPSLPAEFPAAVRELVAAMLAPDPADRPSAEYVAQAADRLAVPPAAAPTTTLPVQPSPTLVMPMAETGQAPWAKRYGLIAAATLVVLAGLFAVPWIFDGPSLPRHSAGPRSTPNPGDTPKAAVSKATPSAPTPTDHQAVPASATSQPAGPGPHHGPPAGPGPKKPGKGPKKPGHGPGHGHGHGHGDGGGPGKD